MEKENWCMQWSGEVLPENAMVPDLSVFLQNASANSQAVTAKGRYQVPLSRVQEIREALCAEGKFPARLKLPFKLSSAERREYSRRISKVLS